MNLFLVLLSVIFVGQIFAEEKVPCKPSKTKVGDKIINTGYKTRFRDVLEVEEVDGFRVRVTEPSYGKPLWIDSSSYCHFIPTDKYGDFKRGEKYLYMGGSLQSGMMVKIKAVSANGYALVDSPLNTSRYLRPVNLGAGELEQSKAVNSGAGFSVGEKVWRINSDLSDSPYPIKSIRKIGFNEYAIRAAFIDGPYLPPEMIIPYKEHKWRFQAPFNPKCRNAEGNTYEVDWLKITNTPKPGVWRFKFEIDDSPIWDSESPMMEIELNTYLSDVERSTYLKLESGEKLSNDEIMDLIRTLLSKSGELSPSDKFRLAQCEDKYLNEKETGQVDVIGEDTLETPRSSQSPFMVPGRRAKSRQRSRGQ